MRTLFFILCLLSLSHANGQQKQKLRLNLECPTTLSNYKPRSLLLSIENLSSETTIIPSDFWLTMENGPGNLACDGFLIADSTIKILVTTPLDSRILNTRQFQLGPSEKYFFQLFVHAISFPKPGKYRLRFRWNPKRLVANLPELDSNPVTVDVEY